MSEEKAAQARPCLCKHPESMHLWDSRVNNLTIASSCAFVTRLEREGDEPNVRYRQCLCGVYAPDSDRR